MSQSFDYDVFLSHSKKDKAVIRRLADKLIQDGVRVWLDELAIQPGESIPLAIENGLLKSRILAICWSKSYAESDWGGLETSTFLFRDPNNRERRFVPLRLDDHEFKETLRQYLYIDYRKRAKKEYERLRDHCRPREPTARPVEVETTEPEAGGDRAPSFLWAIPIPFKAWRSHPTASRRSPVRMTRRCDCGMRGLGRVSASSKATQVASGAWRGRRMASRCFPVPMTRRCGCGMRGRGCVSVSSKATRLASLA
jgi:hypothetical protein